MLLNKEKESLLEDTVLKIEQDKRSKVTTTSTTTFFTTTATKIPFYQFRRTYRGQQH